MESKKKIIFDANSIIDIVTNLESQSYIKHLSQAVSYF